MAGDIEALKKNIKAIYTRKKKLVLALCLEYAGLALRYFRQVQQSNKFWTNRTNIAKDTVFSGPINSNDIVGFFLAHTVQYGVYLELANNRKYQSLLPVVVRFYSRFIRDLEELFEG